MCFVPGLSTSLSPTVVASASPVLLCLLRRLVAVKGQRPGALQLSVGSGSFQLVDSAAACPEPAALVSGNCPCDPEVDVPRLLLLLPRGVVIGAPVLVAVAAGCPIGHSVRLLHDPWAPPGLAGAQTRTQTAAPAAVAGLLGRVAAIAGRGGLSLYSMHGERGRCASLLLCRHRSRPRAAAGAGWCSVT
jgi:hypothetical protein